MISAIWNKLIVLKPKAVFSQSTTQTKQSWLNRGMFDKGLVPAD